MKKIHSAVALFTFTFTLSASVNAATKGAPAVGNFATPTPAAAGAPATPPNPWKLAYVAEYSGPRLESISVNQSQGPNDPGPGYAEIDHSLKLGYGIAKAVNFGTQIRAVTPFDSANQNFVWKDIRFYASWSHMIETSAIDMTGSLDVEAPTSDASKAKGKIIGFRFKNNWVLKTELRNWFFSALTMLNTQFNNNPTGAPGSSGTGDVSVSIFPWITLDLVPNLQLLLEGSFDGSHSYNSYYFDINSADPDYVDIGFLISTGPHIQWNPALRFYTANTSFNTATLFLSFSASL